MSKSCHGVWTLNFSGNKRSTAYDYHFGIFPYNCVHVLSNGRASGVDFKNVGVTNGSGTVYGAPAFVLARLVFCEVFADNWLSSCIFSCDHCIVCTWICGF